MVMMIAPKILIRGRCTTHQTSSPISNSRNILHHHPTNQANGRYSCRRISNNRDHFAQLFRNLKTISSNNYSKLTHWTSLTYIPTQESRTGPKRVNDPSSSCLHPDHILNFLNFNCSRNQSLKREIVGQDVSKGS